MEFRNGPRHNDLTPETPRTIRPRGIWHFTGTVQVLVGRPSASSNETLVAFMREIPHVTIVGDTTAGSSGNPEFVDLVDGWRVGVPRWIVRTADRKGVEGSGIAPDGQVPVVAADFQAGRDPVLEYSVESLLLGLLPHASRNPVCFEQGPFARAPESPTGREHHPFGLIPRSLHWPMGSAMQPGYRYSAALPW